MGILKAAAISGAFPILSSLPRLFVRPVPASRLFSHAMEILIDDTLPFAPFVPGLAALSGNGQVRLLQSALFRLEAAGPVIGAFRYGSQYDPEVFAGVIQLLEKGIGLKKVLNVGGNNKGIPLPPQYKEYQHVLLDIDTRGSPDIVCDARNLTSLDIGQFDAVYCSHNLEHYYRHDVRKVLAGFMHVLKQGGFAHIRVPDIKEVMRITIERGLDIDDELYQSKRGPIMVVDVLYGHRGQIEQSGQDFYAHKTGFTEKSLLKTLLQSGFSEIYTETGRLEINALAFKGVPDPSACALFGVPQHKAGSIHATMA